MNRLKRGDIERGIMIPKIQTTRLDDERAEYEKEIEQLRNKYLSLLKKHREVKRLGRRVLEVAPRVIKCTSVEWDRAVVQFRKAVKKKEE